MDLLKVISATPISGFVMRVAFSNGCKLDCDLSSLIEDQGVFNTLKAPDLFRNFQVEDGVITWSEDLDIAPEYLYKIGKPLAGEQKLPEPDYIKWTA